MKARALISAGLTSAILLALTPAPASAYEQNGTYTPGGSSTMPSGVVVSIAVGAAPISGGSVALAGTATAPAGADTSPAGAAGAPAMRVAISDSGAVDSTYHSTGTLTVRFSRPVRDPRLHLFGLGDTGFGTRLVLTTPGLAVVPRAGWSGWTVSSTQIAPTSLNHLTDGSGSVELLGVVTSAVFRVDGARTSVAGGATAAGDEFDLNTTIDDDLGSAPASYGSAGHAVSDLTIGASVTADQTSIVAGAAPAGQTSDTNDGVITFPSLAGASAGHPYAIDVPVAGVSSPATLAGWIDANGNGRFDEPERATATVPAGATTVTLRWPSLPVLVPGPDRPVRLRLGYDAQQVLSPTGYADSGEVDDRTVTIAGSAGPTCADTVYVASGPNLATFDLATGTATTIGALGADVAALAWNPKDGLLYGVRDGGRIAVIDPATGSTLSLFAPAGMPTGTLTGATIDAAGTLDTFVRGTNTLVRVDLDPASAGFRTAATVTVSGAAIDDGDIAAIGGGLYLIDPASHTLFRIDPATGMRTGMGSVAGGSGNAVVADDAGDLYDISAAGSVHEVDSASATSTTIVATGHTPVSAAAGCLIARDFGDAPSSYGSPSNPIRSGLSLGASIDAEPGPVTARAGEDDALTAFAPIAIGQPTVTLTVPVRNETGAAATLAGWIDTDRDGTFDASERALVPVPAGATTVTLHWTGLSGLAIGRTYARLRLDAGTVADPGPTGAGPAGEIEDYPVRVHQLPSILSPAGSALLATRTPMVSGTAEPGGALRVADGATTVCAVTVTAAGTWMCNPATPFADGSHTLTATNVSPDGDRQVGSGLAFTVDATAPAAPLITAPAANAWLPTATPVISGTGESGSTVTIRQGATIVCATTVAAGAWSCTPRAPLASGSNALTATASDLAGNTTTGSTVLVHVDTVPPPAPLITSPANGATIGGAAAPQIAGTGEPDDTITVADGTGSAVCVATVTATGAWSCVARSRIPDGSVLLTPTATDLAGNSTPGEPTRLTIDTTAPPAAAITAPRAGAVLGTTRPAIAGTGEPGDTVTVRAGGILCTARVAATGQWSCAAAISLPSGPSSLTPTQTDLGGNTTVGVAVPITVDITPPPAPILAVPADGAFINTTTPLITGSGETRDTITVTANGSTRVCTTVVTALGAWSCVPSAGLVAGSVTLRATAADAAGNATAGARTTITIDLTPPPPAVIVSPAAGSVTNNPRVRVAGTAEPADTVDVTDRFGASLCTAIVAADGSWACTPAVPLVDGVATLTPTATDRAGNVTPGAARIVVIDTTPPAAPQFRGPAAGAFVPTGTPNVSGRAEPDATVTVADTEGNARCRAVASPAGTWSCHVAPSLADGVWTLIAIATDPAGNSAPGTPDRFVVDTIAPRAPIIVAPAPGSVTNVRTEPISGTGEAGTLVTVRSGAALICSGVVAAAGTWSCVPGTAFADGVTTIVAISADRAGNSTTSAPTSFTLDATPPPAAVITSPVAGTAIFTNTPVIRGTGEIDDTVLVAAGAETVCLATVQGDGSWSCPVADPLPDGSITLTAIATDIAGNQTPGTPIHVRIDSGLPVAAVITTPADGAYVAATSPAISGTGEAGDTVRVTDTGGGTVCISVIAAGGTWSCRPVHPLGQGPITITPNTTDADGFDIPGSPIGFTVDTVAPTAATITSPVAGSIVNTQRPAFTGRGEAAVVIDVTDSLGASLCDTTIGSDGTWTCTPSQPLPTGWITVTPTASDRAGNVTPGNPVTFSIGSGGQ